MYIVANISLEVDEGIVDSVWKRFEGKYPKANIKVKIKRQESAFYGIEKYELNRKVRYCFRNGTEIMLVNCDWTHIVFLSMGNKQLISAFLIQCFYSHAIKRNMIQLHSSLIEFNGRGLMFLGPSGIGKTTQAELWNKYRDALIINGDIVFVQETPDAFLGWGTPWHGSSPYCENTSVPLKAMIVLKQAPENSIRELTGFEKVTAVSNNVFYPRWLENGMELCLETLDHLLSRIPVYELSCRPDEEAVKLTEETIFGSGSVSD